MMWTYAARYRDFAHRQVIGVNCGGRRLAVYKLARGVFATDETCPHLGASLAEGCVIEHYIECPLHFALFDIITGESDGSMTTRRVGTYATRVEDETIYVDVPGPDTVDQHEVEEKAR